MWLYCPYEEEDTFHWQPMCYQAVPRFGMSVRQTFSNSIDMAVIQENEKGAAIQVSTAFGHVYHVPC